MRKLIIVIMSIAAIGLASCANSSSGDSDDGYEFETGWAGWCKYDDSSTVVYVQYGGDESVVRAGTSSTEYTDSYLTIARDAYKYSRDEVRKYLSDITTYAGLPSWVQDEVKVYTTVDGVLQNISVTGSAAFGDSTHYSVTLNAVGDTATFTGYYYLDGEKNTSVTPYIGCYNSSSNISTAKSYVSLTGARANDITVTVNSLPSEDITFYTYAKPSSGYSSSLCPCLTYTIKAASN